MGYDTVVNTVDSVQDKVYSHEIEALHPDEVSRIEMVQELSKNQETVEYVTQDDLTSLKGQINEALAQLVELFIGVEDAITNLNDRIDLFNKKSGQKI